MRYLKKFIFFLPGGKDTKWEEVWKVVVKETVAEKFDIPTGFTLVDINENNYRNYAASISHLLTDEIAGKMENGLVGFVKSDYLVFKHGEGLVPAPSELRVITASIGPSCLESKYQCCPDGIHPQHGYEAYGCCSATLHGCCPDNISPATAPHFHASLTLQQ